MHSILNVIKRPHYSFLAVGTAVALFLVLVLMRNAALVGDVIVNGNIHWDNKAKIFAALLGGIGMSMGAVSVAVAILTSILFGINVALIVSLARKRSFRAAGRGTVAGLGGVSIGALGIGCASCGTLALTAVFPLVGSTGLLALLPLRGAEFGFFGVAALLLSIYFLAYRTDRGAT